MQLNIIENPCLIVDIITNTNGPKVDSVLKIKSCPAAEHIDNKTQSNINIGNLIIKFSDLINPFCCNKDVDVSMQEKKLTIHII